MSVVVPVIMSGGSGTRLWPLSRSAHPKQLHALVTELSMVQETALRVSKTSRAFRFERPIVVLNEIQHELARLQLEAMSVPTSHFVIEPVARNTAAVAAVAAHLVAREYGPDALVLLLPADHHIRDVSAFHDAIETAASAASTGAITTFGIKPTGPETGYGYIERGEAMRGAFRVERFTEKPNREVAQSFLETGRFFWNAGIFLFGAGAVITEMERLCAPIAQAAKNALTHANAVGDEVNLCAESFAECPSNSFDYAVMEKTDKAVVIPADIGWSDIGAWQALFDVAEDKTADGNVERGDVHLVDTRNSYVMSSGPRVGVVGLSNVVVVVTGDAVLVSDVSRTQDVKELVNALKEEGRSELL